MAQEDIVAFGDGEGISLPRKRKLDEIPVNSDIFLTSLDKLAKIAMQQKDILESQGWTSIHLKLKHGYDYSDLILMGMRPETDKEYTLRVEKHKHALDRQKKKLDRERAQYERLKKKFESL